MSKLRFFLFEIFSILSMLGYAFTQLILGFFHMAFLFNLVRGTVYSYHSAVDIYEIALVISLVFLLLSTPKILKFQGGQVAMILLLCLQVFETGFYFYQQMQNNIQA